jgi:glycosyltransferase involved in cell wall biosynthesis
MECLLKAWSEMPIPFERVTLFTHTGLDQSRLAFPLDRYEVRVVGTPLPDPLWEATALGPAMSEVDVMFGPSYTLPLTGRGNCVVTNHGPSENEPFTYAWMRQNAYEALYFASAHRADRVLTCSRSVMQRLTDVYRIPPRKIEVTYLAASDLFHPIAPGPARREVLARYGLEDSPFILFVGKMARRHYIPNLIRAFADLKLRDGIAHRLVLVGPDYLNLGIMRMAREAGVPDAVTHVEYAVHVDLPAIYSAADLFVFPASHTEGFGIPVLEAMACGTPVVTVNQGSLREVAHGAALTTASPAADELRVAMLRLLNDPDLRRALVAAGFERASAFTWRVTAEKTMEVLRDVAAS